MRHYWSYKEEQCYKDGRRDAEWHRTNYEHERYSECPCDKAYFEGKEDAERQMRYREEEQEMERQEEERQEMLYYAKMLAEQQEQAYYEELYYQEQQRKEQEPQLEQHKDNSLNKI